MTIKINTRSWLGIVAIALLSPLILVTVVLEIVIFLLLFVVALPILAIGLIRKLLSKDE